MSRKYNSNQQGLVSIMVTIMIMVVLSLIVIGFSKLTRRELKQALDQQLSSQAYYAAESGINDAVAAINKYNYPGPKTSCAPLTSPSGYPVLESNVINSANKISYPCLTIDTEPNSLEYGNVDIDKSTVIPVIPKAAVSVSSITVSWQAKNGTTTFGCGYTSGTNTLTTLGSWPCGTGILRLELVKLNATSKRSDLVGATGSYIAYLYPTASGGVNTIALSTINKGNIIGVNCSTASTPKFCSLTITGLSMPQGYLRLQSIYKPSSVTLTALDNQATPAVIQFTKAQAVIDSTGKALDVIRRIQVRHPIGSFYLPDYAIQTGGSICKRLDVTTSTVIFDDPGLGAGVDTTACQVP